MNRIWVRLTLSHALLVLAGILVITVAAGELVALNLRREVARQLAVGSGMLAHMAESGTAPGWHGQMMRRSGAGAPRIILADATGRVVYDWQGESDRTLTALERQLAVVLRDDGGKTVGYVLPVAASALTDDLSEMLRQLRRTVLLAGAVSGLAAVGLSLAVSGSITRPLRRLVSGVRAVAEGDLSRRIDPGGPVETRELAAAFNQMAARLGEAEQQRRDLTADIAHELRTPLAVLQANLSAMLDRVYIPDEQEIAALYDEVLRLSRLVQDLGQLAEFDAGRMQLHLDAVDVGRILGGAVTLFEVAGDDKQVELVRRWPEDLPPVVADTVRLGQVANNLLSNALRHTPAGGRVEVGATADEQAVEVWVADSGEGIPEAERERVFERLWRADHSRSREHGGSGLGLAIARQLVEAMGGSIAVSSAPSGGARFSVRLRRRDAIP